MSAEPAQTWHWLVPPEGACEACGSALPITARRGPRRRFCEACRPPRDAPVLALTVEQEQSILSALARIDPALFDDIERPHYNRGVIGGWMPYSHTQRHYMPMSSRQRRADALAKSRVHYAPIRREMARAGLLGPVRGAGGYGYWT